MTNKAATMITAGTAFLLTSGTEPAGLTLGREPGTCCCYCCNADLDIANKPKKLTGRGGTASMISRDCNPAHCSLQGLRLHSCSLQGLRLHARPAWPQNRNLLLLADLNLTFMPIIQNLLLHSCIPDSGLRLSLRSYLALYPRSLQGLLTCSLQ